MNATLVYMASDGLNNLQAFSKTPSLFGDLSYYLYRDMGLVLPSPIRETVSNMGEGEVIDAPPLERNLKRKRNLFRIDESPLLPHFKLLPSPGHFSFKDNPLSQLESHVKSKGKRQGIS